MVSNIENLPNELLAGEILPHLSWGTLAKVARLSKRFSDITKQVGPFEINLVSENWESFNKDRRAKAVTRMARCKTLVLGDGDQHILKSMSQLPQTQLELLDIQKFSFNNSPEVTSSITALLKVNKPNFLKVLKVTNHIFDQLSTNNIAFPSVHSLTIQADYNGSENTVVKMDPLLKLFPKVKRLEILQCKSDIEAYLRNNIDTPLEYVRLDVAYGGDTQSGEYKALVKEMVIDGTCIETKRRVLTHMDQLTHLELRLPYDGADYAFPSGKNLTRLVLQDGTCSIANVINNAKKLEYLHAPQQLLNGLKLPVSLKCIMTRVSQPFAFENWLSLTNLEKLKITFDGSELWGQDFSCFKNLKEISIDGHSIDQWNPAMNSLKNLTHVTLRGTSLTKIPAEFFKSCTKIVYLALNKNENMTCISRKIRHLKDLECLKMKACGLTSIPSCLKSLHNLKFLDLRNNPFTGVPVTVPVRTVQFSDPEWIRVVQAVSENPAKAPTVKQMLQLPCLTYNGDFKVGSLGRLALHGLGVPDIELDEYDKSSDALASAIMRGGRGRYGREEESDDEEFESVKPAYTCIKSKHELSKHELMALVMFKEFDPKIKLAQVAFVEDNVLGYAFEHPMRKDNDRGWSSRAVWELHGYIYEINQNGIVKEKEKKFIRSIVEPK